MAQPEPGMIRYPKFYGDPNMDHATIDGSFLDREYLGAGACFANHQRTRPRPGEWGYGHSDFLHK